MERERVAIFLDRDGTIIVDGGYLGDPSAVELLPGAREAIGRLKDFGCLLFLFTNQSGVARGLFSVEDALACNARMVELLGCGDDLFADVCLATEMPTDHPMYRKPSPRFIGEMIKKHRLRPDNCHIVGDKVSDVLTGMNAGIGASLISCAADGCNPLAGIDPPAATTIRIFPSILAFSHWLISAMRPNFEGVG
jgi:D-glycero-D-manno-heptose 1,7-bisphosphate phosphatase